MQLTTGYPLPPADVAAAGGTMTYPAMMIPAGLAQIARCADILAPDTCTLIALDAAEWLGVQASINADAHRDECWLCPGPYRRRSGFFLPDCAGTVPGGHDLDGSVAEISSLRGISSFSADDPALSSLAMHAMASRIRENQPVRRVWDPHQSTSELGGLKPMSGFCYDVL
ncbi:hypothetical protein [Pseudomonas poae]|uniref:hypothetical protein n=1 Tax=Pseudomonas poae TaxID=200451 RepID=UPI000A6D61FD|nr:hypothetical protein [Pseudomonas poae]